MSSPPNVSRRYARRAIFARPCVVLIVLLISLLCQAPAQSQDPARIALLIGNADYDYAAPLKNPPNDVSRMAEVLRNLGFDDIETLTDLDEDALEDALVAFQAKAQTADTALVFYSGHGMEIRGQNYLIPIDAKLRVPGAERAEAVSLDLAIEAVSAASRLSIVILDACRTGPPGPRGAKGFIPVQADRPGLAIAFSTRPGEVAWDGTGDTSPYTRALSEALSRAPDQDIRVLLTSLGSKTTQYAGGVQRPFARFGDMPANLVALGLPAAVTPPANPTGLGSGACDGVEVDLASGGTKCIKPGSGESFRDCPECPEMVVVPAGSFMMGSPEGEEGRRGREGPQHEVTIPKPFAVGKFEVTNAQYVAFLNDVKRRRGSWNEPWFRTKNEDSRSQITGSVGAFAVEAGKRDFPVVNVSGFGTKAYAMWLSEKTGKTYRLLSEAEWEYAARAGTTTPYAFGDSISTSQAQFRKSLFLRPRRGKTVEVGSFQPNAWGLHDMHGNVWEWVEDCWNDSYAYKPQRRRATGGAWTTGDCDLRVLRGGSGDSYSGSLRSAFRIWDGRVSRNSFNGFRLARTLTPAATSASACRELPDTLSARVEISEGDEFCDAARQYTARVDRIGDQSIRFVVNGAKTFTCRESEVCGFDWSPGPTFRVTARADRARGIEPRGALLPR